MKFTKHRKNKVLRGVSRQCSGTMPWHDNSVLPKVEKHCNLKCAMNPLNNQKIRLHICKCIDCCDDSFFNLLLCPQTKRYRMENSLIMLGVLFVLISLGSATANNISSKPRDNKVSTLRFNIVTTASVLFVSKLKKILHKIHNMHRNYTSKSPFKSK